MHLRTSIASAILLTVISGALVARGDTPPERVRSDLTRQITIERRYLNFPVKTGAAKRRVSVNVDGQVVREFDIELADAEPQFWTVLDVSAWKGKTATLHLDRSPEDSHGLSAVEQADSILGSEDLYKEALRPQFHFSSCRGWNNDPNGLVFFDGEYHLYYQHNPYGWAWGNMHWGHAVSRDLVHWTELPIALYPRQFGDWAFSGSAVVDANNTSGFGAGAEPPMVGAYTSTARGECIIYSNDHGRTWTKFAGNPVVKHKGRDPRLLWYAPARHWVMAVYDEFEKGRYIAFYTSPDLKQWTFASRIEGFYECPDLFELPVDRNEKDRRWVLTAASSEYMIGQFDGRTFMPQTPKLPGQRGDAMYAAQTFSDIPASDGRRIQIGWGRCPSPGMPFNQMMTFPCELTLHQTPDGPRVFWWPVKEIDSLRRQSISRDAQAIAGVLPLGGDGEELLDIETSFEAGTAHVVGIRLKGLEIRYDVLSHELICGSRRAPVPLENGALSLRILVDRTSVEVFAGRGAVYMPMSHIGAGAAEPQAFGEGGEAKLVSSAVYVLRSAWEESR